MKQRRLSTATVEPLPPGLVPSRAELRGSRVRVEPLCAQQHGDSLYRASHGDAAAECVWHYMPYGPFADRAAFRVWLRACSANLDPIFYALHDLRSGTAQGMASYLRVDASNGCIEMGHIWFAPSLQRTAQATEALYLLMRYALEELRFRRLEWKCNALNIASRRAALRLGFRYEGIFYQAAVVKGRNRDTAWYSLLDCEWPTARKTLERWLAADNFDSAGRQRSSLASLNQVEHKLAEEPTGGC